jgi:hypothetical protein
LILFLAFFRQFCFVARKKFGHVSLLHVVHHGIMPISVWPGMKFIPGGHASFFGLLNSFVHILMYAYYMLSAMGPKYHKYVWWKQHMTTLQMLQFLGIMAHGFQLVSLTVRATNQWEAFTEKSSIVGESCESGS